VQSWRGQESLAGGARQGYSGILSNGYYLDYIHPASRHYAVDPLPPNIALSEAEAARVLGGEACMWAEFVSPETIDSRIWPRMAAIAERFWSPRDVTDVADMYRRLERISVQLEELGLMHASHEDRLLRRIAGGHDIGPLKTLLSVVEPVKVYNRPRLRPATQMMPLTRLVDAARPDAEAARRVEALVNALVQRGAGLKTGAPTDLRMLFESWRDVRPAIDRVMDQSMAAAEAAPLADDLVALGTIGLEALSLIDSAARPPADWAQRSLARIEEASKPKAELEFVIIAPMRALVQAAAP
jgi:hexosaminidase